jgi:hypothetical protein
MQKFGRGFTGTRACRPLHVLKMMQDDIDQFEFERLPCTSPSTDNGRMRRALIFGRLGRSAALSVKRSSAGERRAGLCTVRVYLNEAYDETP